MTADDVRGEDYEAAKPVPARTRVTGDPWVRGHLPECPKNWSVPGDCACEIIRACEARVTNEIWGAIRDGSQYKSGFKGGLDAARDAVVAACDTETGTYYPGIALAAIDALRADHA